MLHLFCAQWSVMKAFIIEILNISNVIYFYHSSVAQCEPDIMLVN